MTAVFPAPDALTPAYRTALRGSLFGTALGDALGAQQDAELAASSVTASASAPGSAGLQISAATQLTLATLDGLTEVLEWNNQGQAADELACIWLAYLRWYSGCGYPAPEAAPFSLPRPLDQLAVMQQRRLPNQATVAALATGQMQFISKNINPQTLDAGALVRSAAFGYLPVADDATVIKLSAHAAALTHGHPEAIISACAYSLLIRYLLGAASAPELPQRPIYRATQAVLDWLGAVASSPALPGDAALTIASLRKALTCADDQLQVAEVRQLFDAGQLVGESQQSPELLGYALALALGAENILSLPHGQTHPGLLLQTLHQASAPEGGCHYVSALVGSLLGAAGGEGALPQEQTGQIDALEALELVETAWFTQLGL